MSTPIFEIKKSCLYTTFQDLGRYGYQKYGVVTSGAMDRYSFNMANLLVGNPLYSAVLEVTLVGPMLLFTASATFAICGANLSPTLNDVPIRTWKTYTAHKGDILNFGKPIEGVYAYLAVSGGFDLKQSMGSFSTYTKAELGSTLHNGDLIYGSPSVLKRNRGLSTRYIRNFPETVTIRYIPGPHLQYFESESITNFENQSFTFKQGDRMGSRLQSSQPLKFLNTNQLPSDPIPFGAIQIPPNGHPIVLLADRQTTGGYPRIGTIISVDIPRFAQLPRFGTVYFKQVTIEQAQKKMFNVKRNFFF
ncbi:biotin-dependent carboxyltransferase family protein [Bacillus salitolerans]|uniref:Biotin-dependent carboxyltransferase family protein n=1 Tax=Bacillus salitolerans TaxID=1437434 RepID=A0ABW4LIU8_9BACI